MVAVYNKNARNQGLNPNEMFAVSGNLLDPNDPSPAAFKGEEWFNFDLVAVGLGFHHFEYPTLAATRLAERLRPGGVLMIIDFMPHEHHGEIELDRNSSAEVEPSRGHGHGRGLFHGNGHDHCDHSQQYTPDSTEGFEKV